jgi:hypothetical protein
MPAEGGYRVAVVSDDDLNRIINAAGAADWYECQKALGVAMRKPNASWVLAGAYALIGDVVLRTPRAPALLPPGFCESWLTDYAAGPPFQVNRRFIRGKQTFTEPEARKIFEALGSAWLPVDWEITVAGDTVTIIRGTTGERLTVDQALNLRDLLTTTSKMVSEGRFRRRA